MLGIIGAMPEEVSFIKEHMRVTSVIERGSRIYYKGILEDNEIILVFSKWGKVAAASTTTTLIDYFNCKSIIFTGVAGGVDSSLNIGDMVIGTSAYQHDLDARPFFSQFQIPLTDKIFISASYELELFEKAATDFLNNITDYLSPKILSSFNISQPKLAKGIIASGDQFITNTLEYPNFTSPEGLASAVEMEGAAVAQICDDHHVPFIIIRTISDKADHSAVIDFQKFIKDVAGAYSFGVIKQFLSYLNLRQTEDLAKQQFHHLLQ